jgi:plastocyanin
LWLRTPTERDTTMRRIRRILLAAALVAAIVAIAGCSGSSGSSSSTPSSSGGSGASAGSGSGSSAVTVSLKNFAFDPSSIDVAVGGSVTFVNNDSVAHDVVCDGWDSGQMAPGATYAHTFATAGTFPIHCSIHPQMTASVTVK